ncbi:MAG: MBL fold metallo-hydrolase [Phycisphaerae bacterium]|nr:MBL fold metallo-hydrolase [Gemmatimonadaceae bacterium]
MTSSSIRRATILGTSALLLTATATPATTQPRTADPIARGLQLTDFPRFVKIAPNVYGYEEIRSPGFTTVSLIVVGTKGVLIADGQGSAQATQTMLDKIKTITTQPIKWYVVGSDHGDHTAGNSVLPAGITYVISSASKAILDGPKARTDSANERAATEAKVKGTTAPAPRYAFAPPKAMSGNKETIDVGGISVDVLNLGRAHTGGDLMVHLPRERVLFMSEAYLNRVFPAMRSAYPSEWVATIDKALAMNVNHYIPGHGFIESPAVSREELVAFKDAVKAVITEVTRLRKLGLSADDAVKQANWGVYKDWFIADQQAPIAVRKVYEELDGKLK